MRRPETMALRLLITGTDTGVGKTYVTCLLARGLRALGRKVWLHKVVAAGSDQRGRWDDVDALERLLGDGQLRETVCPLRLPEAASPHMAARAAGRPLGMDGLLANLHQVEGDHDLLVEGVGGLGVTLTQDLRTVADYAAAARLRLLIVTRPSLGTLNHSLLTVEYARSRGLELAGLVLNHHAPMEPSLAVRTAHSELTALTCLPVLATIRHGQDDEATARALAEALLVNCLSLPAVEA